MANMLHVSWYPELPDHLKVLHRKPLRSFISHTKTSKKFKLYQNLPELFPIRILLLCYVLWQFQRTGEKWIPQDLPLSYWSYTFHVLFSTNHTSSQFLQANKCCFLIFKNLKQLSNCSKIRYPPREQQTYLILWRIMSQNYDKRSSKVKSTWSSIKISLPC